MIHKKGFGKVGGRIMMEVIPRTSSSLASHVTRHLPGNKWPAKHFGTQQLQIQAVAVLIPVAAVSCID